MKQFFKFTLASVVGTLAALFIASIGFFFFVMILVSALSTEEVVTISDNTVLEIQLNYSIPERTNYKPSRNFDLFLPEFEKELGLNDILANLRQAERDENISGIYLNLNNFIAGSYSNVNEVREGLLKFKESGKFLIAHGNRISQKAYFLASAADKIYLTPTGDLDLRGMMMELTFFKKTLDKLDIEPQIFQSGKYKSAVEMFSQENMSNANREQLDAMLNSVYDNSLKIIADARGIDIIELKSVVDRFDAHDKRVVVEKNLIDGILYYDEVVDSMKSEIGLTGDKRLRRITLEKYDSVPDEFLEYSRNRIAVIYANGEIHEGTGDEESIGLENISRELRKVRNSSSVKAVVLRVNSPGGSPLTSEQILREVKLTADKMPVVASFGSVAASGGYYIASGVEEIICDPYTITGSIGAFGIIPNMQKFFDGKLGITFDRIQKGKYADMYTLTKPLNADEKKMIRFKIDEIYDTFIMHVAQGRGMSAEYVEEIAQGRVWSGIQAREIGLVDKLGGISEAVERASVLAGLENYRIVEYPAIKEPFEKLMDLLGTQTYSMVNLFAEDNIEDIISRTKEYILERGILTRMPVDIYIY